jgi:hypothetical protein
MRRLSATAPRMLVLLSVVAPIGLLAPSAGAQVAPPAAPAPLAAPQTDHQRFVGSFAVGFLGVQQIQIANANGGTEAVNAPVIGGRYWLRDSMGVDAGIGFSFAGGSTTTEAGDTSTKTDQPQPAALILHAGAPFVFADSTHFVFEVIPELNLGFAGNTIEVGDDEIGLGGFHLDLGARVGGELHFGFVGIPQLALQAGVGVAINYNRTSLDNGATDTVVRSSNTSFSTNVGSDPWDLFTGSISALYYFGP